jgi:hypothetical protein
MSDRNLTTAIITIEILDSNDEMPAVIAIQTPMTEKESSTSWDWPCPAGIENIVSRVVNSIAWDNYKPDPAWTIRSVRRNQESDHIALLPGETLMSIEEFNAHLSQMQAYDDKSYAEPAPVRIDVHPVRYFIRS